MKLTSEGLLDLLYNRKLPQLYRDADRDLMTFPLKRYLQSLIDGGYCGSIEDIERALLLVDPQNVPEEFLPYLCESFGLPYFKDIDPTYTRKFLANYSELYRRRGTFSCVRYLARVLTGMDAKLSYVRGEYEGAMGRHLIIDLQAENLQDILNMDTSKEIIRQFVGLFIPYYITTYLTSSIANQVVRSEYLTGGAVATQVKYKINPFGNRVVKAGMRIRTAHIITSEVSYHLPKEKE